jgi:hypothetical protein
MSFNPRECSDPENWARIIKIENDASAFLHSIHPEPIKEQYPLMKQMLQLIESYGATNIFTNGYVYHFNYNGKRVSFVDQEDRLCIEIFRDDITIPINILDNMGMLKYINEDLYNRLSTEIQYKDYNIDGDDSLYNLSKLLSSL